LQRGGRLPWFTWLRWLLPAALVLGAFCAGAERYRGDLPDVQRRFEESPASLLWPPTEAWVLFVSRDSDERLYYQYARLVLGLPADLAYAARRRDKPIEALRVRPGDAPRLPYRDFSLEYPPGALAAFLPPYLVTSSLAGYRLAFGLWMGVFALGTAALGVRMIRQLEGDRAGRSAARHAAWLLFAVGPLVTIRFDPLPAFLCALAVACVCERRPGLAGAALGVAVATKLYPVILVPPLALAVLGAGDRKGALVLGVATAAAAALVVLPFALLAGPGLAADLLTHAERPLQLESALATPLLALAGAKVVQSHGSANLIAAGAAALAQLSGVATLAAVALGSWLAYRNARRDLARAAITGALVVLVGAVVASKVLSPQYLLWFVPLVVAWPNRGRVTLSIVLGAAGLLAQVWYPFLYEPLKRLEQPFVGLLALRNLLLLGGLVLAARWATRAGDGETMLRRADGEPS
jgi:hypothetical protein